MENNSEDLNDNMFYNDNYVKNYEDMACCSNSIITNFFQENAANILNYLNGFCYNNEHIDEEAQIIRDPDQKLKTPLCSQLEKNNNNIIEENNNINNYINNNINNNVNNNINNNANNNIRNSFNLLNSNIINNNENSNNNNNPKISHNNNNHSLNNSLLSEIINPSNDSAAEPIMTQSKYNNIVDQSKKRKKNNNNILHKKRTNLFNVIKDVFKDFFSDNENNENNSESEKKLKHRPILKKIIEKDIVSPLQNQTPQANGRNNNTILRHANTHIAERPQLFADDIISFNISEDKDDINLKKLVSFIPVFTVKDKNKRKDNNKCTICLSEFEIGEKKSTLPCMHSFHYNCIERWMKSKKYCPICKFQISLETLKNSLEQNYK